MLIIVYYLTNHSLTLAQAKHIELNEVGGTGMNTNDDLLSFAEDTSSSDDQSTHEELDFWHLMVVDDEPEVHSVTRLALKGFDFLGKKLKIHSANSASEAKKMLLSDIPFAIALIDVVMETDHAGLNLVRWIREDQKNLNIRLVLRTGQPGQAPEREVITNYDINDYKEKTELTSNKLYTLTYSCLRAYRDIIALYENKLGLETIIQSSNKIFAHQSLDDFTQGALQQLCALLHIDTGAFYSNVDSIAASHGEAGSKILAATGRFRKFLHRPLEELLNSLKEHQLKELYNRGGQHFGEDCFIGVYDSHIDRQNLLFLEGVNIATEADKQLVKLFGANIGVAFDNQSMFDEVETTQREMIYRMSEAVESRSKETSNHVKRVALTCQYIARAHKLTEREINIIYKAAPLHDIGKIAIPDHVLNKPGKLTPDEWKIMKTHAQIGFDILSTSELEILRAGSKISGEHHENWDGSGYPNGKKGEDIHIFGRIAAIADVLDALINKRCYKTAWPIEEAMAFIREMSGVKFDPKLVDLVFEHQSALLNIQNKYAD